MNGNQDKSGRQRRTSLYIKLLALCLLLLATWWMALQFTPVAGNKKTTLAIAPGDSSKTIAVRLQQAGIIRNLWAFRIYLAIHGESQNLRPGAYRFSQGDSFGQIAGALISGDLRYGTIRFTVPEGYKIDQIAALLASKGLASKADFLHEVDHGVFSFDFLKVIPPNVPVHHRLEGFLFPNTYQVNKGESAHDIIQAMLEEFNRVLTQQMRTEIANRHEDLYQVVTVASLIEREAKVEKERPIIAGVIYNRLNAKTSMPLQIDASVEYAVGEKPRLSTRDLEVKSPYNLYLYSGLPPGPIASPGLASLMAAINPAKTPYLYYVAKYDGTGQHFFSETFAQQLHNEQISEKNASK